MKEEKEEIVDCFDGDKTIAKTIANDTEVETRYETKDLEVQGEMTSSLEIRDITTGMGMETIKTLHTMVEAGDRDKAEFDTKDKTVAPAVRAARVDTYKKYVEGGESTRGVGVGEGIQQKI